MRTFIRFSAIAASLLLPVAGFAQGPNSQPASSTASASASSQSGQATASQQPSLADAARKAREEKKSTKPAKVYTNDNIPTSGGISSAAAATPASENGASDNSASAAPTESSSASSGKDEKAWRAKFAQLHQKLDRDKDNLDVMQRELAVLSTQYYNDPTKAMQQQYSRDDINKKTADIEAKKKDIDADQQALDDAEDDLRKAGGDPGWAR